MFSFSGKDDLTAIDRRLRRMEQLLEAIAARLELTPAEVAAATAPRVSAEVARLAAEGRKIEAIRVLRREQGLDLRTAKDVVDGLG